MTTGLVRVVLDLDGVILKTNGIKHKAMLGLFADHVGQQEAINDYILANGGVRRDIKLAHILQNILQLKLTPTLLAGHLGRYAAALAHELAAAPMVEGVAAFIQGSPYPLYVSSSAPEAEVDEQLMRRQLTHAFRRVFGSRTSKAEALRIIATEQPVSTVVFFGDSLGDLEAAEFAGVGFVGVISERDNFVERSVRKLNGFSSPEEVADCIRQAARPAA